MVDRLKAWRDDVLGENTLMVLAAIATGLLAALAAVVLKLGVNELTRLLHRWLFGSERALLVLIIPTAGILLSTLFTQVWLKGDLGRGLPSLLKEMRERAGIVQRHKLYSQVVTSILTMGTGGSAGMEAPIASTGAAFGSRLGLRLGVDEGKRNLLLACGSAAGISAIFNAPIAGAIFAMEVILVNVAVTHMVHVMIASASAAFLSSLIYKGQPFVLITGEVPTDEDKAKVEDAIGRLENVRSVVNELGVGANSSFGSRSNDTLLTTKVKATLVDAKDLQANAFKVLTERGEVFLMGRVTEREANRSADVAASVPGVKKVVKVFEVITEDELAGIAKAGGAK